MDLDCDTTRDERPTPGNDRRRSDPGVAAWIVALAGTSGLLFGALLTTLAFVGVHPRPF